MERESSYGASNGEAFAILRPGEAPDVSFVPPLVRRRLSPLQKIYFSLVRRIGGAEPVLPAFIFASRDGEDTLTRRIVEDFRSDGSVSPHRFSSSVYNAAPGLWSVFMKNTAPYTAIAAGDDTIECGLVETSAALKTGRPAVFVYAEETDGGYGAAMKVGGEGAVGSVSAGGAVGSMGAGETGDGVDEIAIEKSPCLSFADLVDFLLQPSKTLVGKWITLSHSCVD